MARSLDISRLSNLTDETKAFLVNYIKYIPFVNRSPIIVDRKVAEGAMVEARVLQPKENERIAEKVALVLQYAMSEHYKNVSDDNINKRYTELKSSNDSKDTPVKVAIKALEKDYIEKLMDQRSHCVGIRPLSSSSSPEAIENLGSMIQTLAMAYTAPVHLVPKKKLIRAYVTHYIQERIYPIKELYRRRMEYTSIKLDDPSYTTTMAQLLALGELAYIIYIKQHHINEYKTDIAQYNGRLMYINMILGSSYYNNGAADEDVQHTDIACVTNYHLLRLEREALTEEIAGLVAAATREDIDSSSDTSSDDDDDADTLADDVEMLSIE